MPSLPMAPTEQNTTACNKSVRVFPYRLCNVFNTCTLHKKSFFCCCRVAYVTQLQ